MFRKFFSYLVVNIVISVRWCVSIGGLFLLASCHTIRTVETIATHDTITTHHTDTVRQYVMKTQHDTIHHFTERIVTVNEGGDTIRLVSNTIIREKVIERDSATHTHHSADSLAQSTATHTAKEKKTTKPSLRGIILLGIILGGCIIVLLTLGPPLKKKNKE